MSVSTSPFSYADVKVLSDVARGAGQLIMQMRGVHRQDAASVNLADKQDGSPVTKADHAAQHFILEGITRLGLMHAVIAEEQDQHMDLTGIDGFYSIDPLDGTKAFIGGGDDFSVNIGFVQKGVPVMGVLHMPVAGDTYFSTEHEAFYQKSAGSAIEPIKVRTPNPEGLDVIVNRTEDWSGRLKNYLGTHQVREIHRRSSAHKLGLIAHGKFDLYPRFGPTMEWDIAAGHAILRAAGGRVMKLDGLELGYGKPGLKNPSFIAQGW